MKFIRLNLNMFLLFNNIKKLSQASQTQSELNYFLRSIIFLVSLLHFNASPLFISVIACITKIGLLSKVFLLIHIIFGSQEWAKNLAILDTFAPFTVKGIFKIVAMPA